MNESAANLAPEESEFERFGFTARPSVAVKAPGIQESPVHFECEVMQILNVGHGPGGANIVIGRVLHMHIDDSILGDNGLADPDLLQAIGRMGGTEYCQTSSRFSLSRPG